MITNKNNGKLNSSYFLYFYKIFYPLNINIITSIKAITLINYTIPNYSNVNSVPPTLVICNSTSTFTLLLSGNEFLIYFSQSLNAKYHKCALTFAVKLPLN